MKRLKAYSEGQASWHSDGQPLGSRERAACHVLHANIVSVVERCLQPIMDRVTTREMEGFTLHDRYHGLKVAHLMWHIIGPSRRETLTPAEIGLLVMSAHLHDIGMGLSPEERKARLAPDSDLWDNVDPDGAYAKALAGLSHLAEEKETRDEKRREAVHQIAQAEEALLCADNRERHATRERYQEILELLKSLHENDRDRVPDPESAFVFDGDSFQEKLIEICISHNEDAHVLTERDPANLDQWRFPTRYPVGCCLADCKLCAAALRLADILDFDRERTPAVLFHYLLPRSAAPSENVSVKEWSKHLSISNWEIDSQRIVFRGRSPSAFVHHVILEFCREIEDEIARTRSVFGPDDWPFRIVAKVEGAIEAVGYRYAPYRFSLDQERVYELLMGKSIYNDRLDAIRELIQNAVDACRLRDAVMLCHDQSMVPSKERRIVVRYEEPRSPAEAPVISVIDTGIGMDRYIIENFFLRVGRSYYKSADFLRTRAALRKQNLDFKPVSEFGIGFMAVFMLGDRVEVETARWQHASSDPQRRKLRIDGVGRLVEVVEESNTKQPRFYGTRVSVKLARSSDREDPPTWEELEAYIRDVCRNVEYPIVLQHETDAGQVETVVEPEGLQVPIPDHLREAAFVIPVDDPTAGLLGQIVFFRAREGIEAQSSLVSKNLIQIRENSKLEPQFQYGGYGFLLRGGFSISRVYGLPEFPLSPNPDARIEVTQSKERRHSLPVTDLARSRLLDSNLTDTVTKCWFTALLERTPEIERRPLGDPIVPFKNINEFKWLENYDALCLYRLARTMWLWPLRKNSDPDGLIANWEAGTGDPVFVARQSDLEFHWEIFKVILPRITKLLIRKYGVIHAYPPIKNWENKLRGWHSYLTKPETWDVFMDYSEQLQDVLIEVSGEQKFFNKNYKDRFENMNNDELSQIPDILRRVVSGKEYNSRVPLTMFEISLLDKLMERCSGLTISYIDSYYKLTDIIKLPQSGRASRSTN